MKFLIVPRKINVICDRALLGCYAAGSYVVDLAIVSSAIKIGVDSGIPNKRRHVDRSAMRRAGDSFSSYLISAFSPKTLVLFIVLALGIIAVSFAVGTAIYMANVKEKHEAQVAEARIAQSEPVPLNPMQVVWAADEATSAAAEENSKLKETPVPTPTPTLEDYKKTLANAPNWVYESRDINLVRVNNPALTLLACKFSMLHLWGTKVNLEPMASRTNDMEKVDVEERNGIHYIPVPGNLNTIVRYNVPVIVRLKLNDKDKASLRSEYIVLLKADGQQIVFGDPLWGVSSTTKNELMDKWNGATAMFVDVDNLGAINRGERNERVKSLQMYCATNTAC